MQEQLKISGFPQMLRRWRQWRKYSQLELALRSEVSQRHISFLESGRAQPSREMILQLCNALEIPHRERNGLFEAAGFRPVYPHHPLSGSAMALVNGAVQLLLEHHQPFPAFVLDRHWQLLDCNRPGMNFLRLLGADEHLWQQVDPSGQRNVMRLTFHSQGLQPYIGNWQEVGPALLLRLRKEAMDSPGDEALRTLYNELQEWPSAQFRPRRADAEPGMMPVLPFVFEFPLPGEEQRQRYAVISMITSFGTAQDLAADEIRVETFFPTDAASREFLLGLTELSRGDGGREAAGGALLAYAETAEDSSE